MELERSMHHRVVSIPDARVKVARVDGVQALVMVEGAVAYIPKARQHRDGEYRKPDDVFVRNEGRPNSAGHTRRARRAHLGRERGLRLGYRRRGLRSSGYGRF